MDVWTRIALALLGTGLLALALALPILRRSFRRAVTVESPFPFGEMVKRAGIGPDGADGSERELAVAASRCASCKSREACNEWLEAPGRSGWPEFCPNKPLLRELQQVAGAGPLRDSSGSGCQDA